MSQNRTWIRIIRFAAILGVMIAFHITIICITYLQVRYNSLTQCDSGDCRQLNLWEFYQRLSLGVQLRLDFNGIKAFAIAPAILIGLAFACQWAWRVPEKRTASPLVCADSQCPCPNHYRQELMTQHQG